MQPGVGAVRIDAAAHKVSVATVGRVDTSGLAEKLAATVAGVESMLGRRGAATAPRGYSLRRDGQTLVMARDTCETAEKLWLWREMEWPEITRGARPNAQPEWRMLAMSGRRQGALGSQAWPAGSPPSGRRARRSFPGCFSLVALFVGAWDAAADTWVKSRGLARSTFTS